MGASGLSMLSIDTSSGRQTIFQSLMEFKDALDNPPLTPADQPAFQASMDKALADLSAGVDRLIDQRAIFGSRLAQVDTESERLKTLETTMTIARSEERRVGQECVRTCRSRRSPYQ